MKVIFPPLLLVLLVCACEGKSTPIAPGEAKAGYEVQFSSPAVSKEAELVAKERLRAAGARSYQVWRRESVVKARVVSIADPESVRALLASEKGEDTPASMAELAKGAPYPEAPAEVRVVAPDAL